MRCIRCDKIEKNIDKNQEFRYFLHDDISYWIVDSCEETNESIEIVFGTIESLICLYVMMLYIYYIIYNI